MKISFACPHCAKPLVADAALAGRTGRCRYCGQRTVVPSSPSVSGRPSVSGSPGQIASGKELVAPAQAADWRTAVARQLPTTAGRPGVASASAEAKAAADTAGDYSLRPVTPVRVPAVTASDWDNAELGPAVAAPPSVFTSPANVAPKRPREQSHAAPSPSRVAPSAKAVSSAGSGASASSGVAAVLANVFASLASIITPGAARPASDGAAPALVAYRSFFGLLGRATAWISETSYTVSFILIILAVASGMIGRHSLAAMACGSIVALNLVGLAGDIASLVTLSFRKNPLQGGLFLIPPFTLYYLWTDWQRYRDTIDRMRIPLVTLALVAAAYVFVPWLRGGIKAEVPAIESVEKAVDTVEEELAGQKGVLDEGLKKARSWLRDVPLPDPSSLPGSHGTHQPAPGRKP